MNTFLALEASVYFYLLQLANAYRCAHGQPTGVVIIYQQAVVGWMNELRNPQGWQPHCYAVMEDGDVFEAVYGDDVDGAEMWINASPLEHAA